MACYTFEKLHFPDPAFGPYIRTSYLITMHGSTRAYLHQLAEHRPTSTVFVVHNRGFRRCAKDGVTNSAQDLWHANRAIMEHAAGSGEHPVLILEDDVEFTDEFRARAQEIERFVMRTPSVQCYNLGGIPLLSVAAGPRHLRAFLCGCAHAVIYTQSARRSLVRVKKWPGTDLHDLQCSARTRTYLPDAPVATQRFVQTENSAVWNVCGLPRAYLRWYGDAVFSAHHAFGRVGGLAPLALVALTMGMAVLVAVLKILTGTRRASV